MAQYGIKHSCGHSETVQLYGKSSEREARMSQMSRRPCQACTRKAQTERAEANAAAASLPTLTGSDKQIVWAMTIRDKALAELAELLTGTERKLRARYPEQADEAMTEWRAAADKVRNQTAAAWWIDHRTSTAAGLVKSIMS